MQRGILGGTFDPPHIAHLFAGQAGYDELALDVVHFLPAGAPWQKADRALSPPEHRLEMTRLACEGVDYFIVDDREVLRNGWTYTADTIETFDPSDELTLIVGSDAASGIPTWHRSEDVLLRCRIAVMPRPGVNRTAVLDALPNADVVFLDTPEIVLSGTALRARVGRGLSIRFLVTSSVDRYIAEHDLFREIDDSG